MRSSPRSRPARQRGTGNPRSFLRSADGVKQVERLAEALSSVPFNRAVCSDYPWARQTNGHGA